MSNQISDARFFQAKVMSTIDTRGPMTTEQLAARLGCGKTKVRQALRVLINENVLARKTRWIGALAHTYVYVLRPPKEWRRMEG